MSLSLSLVFLGLVQAEVAGVSAPDGAGPALVVVALPDEADAAIVEALNRLRGEATSVGFEVRLVTPAVDPLSLPQLENLWSGLRPAALVTFTRPEGDAKAQHALEVTFLDRGSGKTTVARFDAGEVADAQERADVILAVRAVDFIRARMFDTLAGRRAEAAPAPAPPPARIRHVHLAAGLAILGAPPGFLPSLAPQLAAGYHPTSWLRIGVMAAGFGTEPSRATEGGSVSLAQRYVGVTATLLGPRWHRLRPAIEVGAGEHWVVARGDPRDQYTGETVTLASPAALAAVGFAFEMLPYLALELRGGTLWLHSEAQVFGTGDRYLGSLGLPIWLGQAMLCARF